MIEEEILAVARTPDGKRPWSAARTAGLAAWIAPTARPVNLSAAFCRACRCEIRLFKKTRARRLATLRPCGNCGARDWEALTQTVKQMPPPG